MLFSNNVRTNVIRRLSVEVAHVKEMCGENWRQYVSHFLDSVWSDMIMPVARNLVRQESLAQQPTEARILWQMLAQEDQEELLPFAAQQVAELAQSVVLQQRVWTLLRCCSDQKTNRI